MAVRLSGPATIGPLFPRSLCPRTDTVLVRTGTARLSRLLPLSGVVDGPCRAFAKIVSPASVGNKGPRTAKVRRFGISGRSPLARRMAAFLAGDVAYGPLFSGTVPRRMALFVGKGLGRSALSVRLFRACPRNFWRGLLWFCPYTGRGIGVMMGGNFAPYVASFRGFYCGSLM